MSIHTFPSRLPVEWQHLSHLRAREYEWALRDTAADPATSRAAAVGAITELAALITELRAERRRYVKELAEFDKTAAIRADGPRVGARVTVHRDLVFWLPGVTDNADARKAVVAVVNGDAEAEPDWIVDREMPRIPSVRVTESPNEIEGITT